MTDAELKELKVELYDAVDILRYSHSGYGRYCKMIKSITQIEEGIPAIISMMYNSGLKQNKEILCMIVYRDTVDNTLWAIEKKGYYFNIEREMKMLELWDQSYLKTMNLECHKGKKVAALIHKLDGRFKWEETIPLEKSIYRELQRSRKIKIKEL